MINLSLYWVSRYFFSYGLLFHINLKSLCNYENCHFSLSLIRNWNNKNFYWIYFKESFNGFNILLCSTEYFCIFLNLKQNTICLNVVWTCIIMLYKTRRRGGYTGRYKKIKLLAHDMAVLVETTLYIKKNNFC